MRKVIYHYNAETCRYEPEVRNGKRIFKTTAVFLFASLLVASTGFFLYNEYADSISEAWLKQQNKSLRSEWKTLEKRIDNANQQLSEYIEKDDHNYRIILDSEPLQTSIRDAGIGGSEKITDEEVEEFPDILHDYKRLDKLKRQIDIEIQSFTDINKLLDKKIKMWSSRPAIQPIDNRQLDQLHLTYGLRMHPLFHIVRPHKGLDFAAPKGTPVYATGDGKITMAYASSSYGNVIYVDHGHGFETRYAHLSAFKVSVGQYVKRGQVIGLVGNTGVSKAPHLHYEVLINGEHTNPINFFQRDLSNKEYEKLIQLGTTKSEPLD